MCARQHSGDAEVTNLSHTVATHEDILRLQIAMDDASVVAVLDTKRYHGEPEEHLLLREVVFSLALLELLGQVAIVAVLHHDVELAIAGAVNLREANDVGVKQGLKDVCLLKRLLLLFVILAGDVDILYDEKFVGLRVLHEVSLAVRTLAELRNSRIGWLLFFALAWLHQIKLYSMRFVSLVKNFLPTFLNF